MQKRGSRIDEFFENNPIADEEICWEGSPQPPVPLTFFGYQEDRFPDSRQRQNLVALLMFTYLGAANGLPVLFFGCIGVFFAFYVLPYLQKRQTLNETYYVATNSRILFQSWGWGGTTCHQMGYADFGRANCVLLENGAGIGTIYLMTGVDVGFWTHDLADGERRHHPTLEWVRDAAAVCDLIDRLKRGGAIAG